MRDAFADEWIATNDWGDPSQRLREKAKRQLDRRCAGGFVISHPEFVVHDDTCGCFGAKRLWHWTTTGGVDNPENWKPCAGRGVYWTPRSEQ